MSSLLANQIFAACLATAAQNYHIPQAVLVGILHVEGGKIGQQVRNTNGSYDLGPMQINTLWTQELSGLWNVDPRVAHRWVRDDGCTNVNVAAWILRGHLDETKSLSKAIAHYHSRTPTIGSLYKKKVIDVMRRKGLITGIPAKPGATTPTYNITTAANKSNTQSTKVTDNRPISFRMR